MFIDFKKAFDTINHQILLGKLYGYGITGTLLKWFEDYLAYRSQYVIYDGNKLGTKEVKCGVPQGSILGPLLFIITMNDICNVSDLLFAIKYADDTCLLVHGNDIHTLIKQLNSELQCLSGWFKSNKLSLNTKKTFYIIFHKARLKNTDHRNMDVIMDHSTPTKVVSLKYLGVIVDHKLNCIDHIPYVKNKISKGIGIMYKARRYLNIVSFKIFIMLIFIHISHIVLKYGDLLPNGM